MKKDTIKEVVEKLNRNYLTEELFMPKKGRRLPERAAVIEIIRDLRQIIFPGYFGKDSALELDTAYYDRIPDQPSLRCAERADHHCAENIRGKKRM